MFEFKDIFKNIPSGKKMHNVLYIFLRDLLPVIIFLSRNKKGVFLCNLGLDIGDIFPPVLYHDYCYILYCGHIKDK